MNSFSHVDMSGHPCMVDVSDKEKTLRKAEAEAIVLLPSSIANAIANNQIAKGNVFVVAEIAGIQAAKKTPQLIPLCHPINIDFLEVKCFLRREDNEITIRSKVIAKEVTGIEMEALTAVSVAALTIYDMCKGIDKGMVINSIHLLKKSGGKSGEYEYIEREVV